MDRFSNEWIDALKRLIGYMKEDVGTLAEVVRLTRVSRFVLTNFLSEKKAVVPTFRKIGKICDAIQAHVEVNPECRTVTLGKSDLDVVFGAAPFDRYSDFKKMAQMRDDELAELSKSACGDYLSFRPYNGLDGPGVFVSHVRIMDRFARAGLPIFHMRRRMNSGDTLSIDGSLSTKNGRLYMLGYDTTTGDMTTMTLLHPGRSFRVITGFATGFERSGPAYTVPFVVSRMKEPMGFLQADPNTSQQIRDITGLINSNEELEEIAEKYLEVGVGVLDRIANKENSYMSLSSD